MRRRREMKNWNWKVDEHEKAHKYIEPEARISGEERNEKERGKKSQFLLLAFCFVLTFRAVERAKEESSEFLLI
jgi:hypothetical protein